MLRVFSCEMEQGCPVDAFNFEENFIKAPFAQRKTYLRCSWRKKNSLFQKKSKSRIGQGRIGRVAANFETCTGVKENLLQVYL